MIQIPLHGGHFALADEDDAARLIQYKWNVTVSKSGNAYARTWTPYVDGKRIRLSMHRFVMNAPKGVFIDHANGNGLDNRKENLRFCTRSQNAMNMRTTQGKRPFKGTQAIAYGRFKAHIRKDGILYHLGCFATAEEAAAAYDDAAMRMFGQFANLNFPKVANG